MSVLTILTVINIILTCVLVLAILTLLAELYTTRSNRKLDDRRRTIEQERRKVEHTLVAAVLCRLDNLNVNMSKWFEMSTGQRWVDVPRDDISKKLRSIEKIVEDMKLDEVE